MHARIENNVAVQYPITNLRQHLPNISLPADLSNDAALPEGYVYVNSTAAPTFNPVTQKVQQGLPVLVDGKWMASWEIIELDDYEISENEVKLHNAQKVAYDEALTNHLDSVAKSKQYDNRVTCALRAGYPGPFQAEGQAFATWMDTCNAMSYLWWAEIEAGTRPMFSAPEEFIAQLPPFSWPQ